MLVGRQSSFRPTYIPPLVHLAICAVALLAYVLPPQLQFLGILWVILNVVDFPVSGVSMAIAWQNGVFAGAWIIVVGTLWWYFLSIGIASLSKKLRA
jgi:hypothetical protein